ncbi:MULTISPECIES: hypothetical protein [unclassified Pseudoxanthomonas]|uniref:hypothetical protein n=1 Tax=unclassified Pseudoxanthomonas TaxID=2645906 RepID=UPI0008EA9E36|nr:MULTISPECIES: hypothetical protein [unclassified Pseudoxanthomonas]SFV29514.1 hypothetical protein SAMN05428990_1335 [Pseudoxanthomonas sp. YR558]
MTNAGFLVLAALCATGCQAEAPEYGASEDFGRPPPPLHYIAEPHAQFLANLRPLCGKAYAGRITANQPASTTPDPFEGKTLVMHVRGCDDPTREIRIPFHVGDDRSRTWVLTRTGTGVRLKHDHRHEDGSPDAVTMYGGDTAEPGSTQRQAFPVDVDSIAMFQREGLAASVTNTWAMELVPGKTFVYELSRPNGRLFRVEFDLTTPVELPPAPWGAGG